VGVVVGAPRRRLGLDRLLGMGLKYNDRFTHTHLGDRPDVR
jgi:hypothetical protein